jgi:DNA polymerase I
MARRKYLDLRQEALPLGLVPTMRWPAAYFDLISNSLNDDPIVSLDVETEGLNPFDKERRIISIALSSNAGEAYTSYVLHGWKPRHLSIIKELLQRRNVVLVGHNIKFDLNWLRVKLGIKRIRAKVFDTMFAYYLLNENAEKKTLEACASKYTDMGDYKEGLDRSDIKRWAQDDVLIYNGKDADAGRRLFDVFLPKLKKQKLLPIMATAMEVLPVLHRMETDGVYLDQKWARDAQRKMFNRMIENRQKINELARTKVNPDSPKSLSNLLYQRMKLPVEFLTKKGAASTGKEAIKKALEHVQPGSRNEKILRAIQEEKKDAKILGTYFQPIPEWTAYDGRVHSHYRFGKQADDKGYGGTVTGRLSSDDPNLQNIPLDLFVRGMFAASPEGWIFFDGDYSQLELRVAAFLSKEPLLIQAFEEGLDVHTLVMSDLLGRSYEELSNSLNHDEQLKVLRVAIKRVNFGILYGIAAKRLQKILWLDLGVTWTVEKCNQLINQWLGKYKKVAEWIKRQKYFAVQHKYVRMPFGQIRRLPDAEFRTSLGERALRQATNFPVQSTASWICLVGMYLLERWITSNSLNARLLMQVHDSIALEFRGIANAARVAKQIARIMERDVLEYIKEVFGIRWDVPLQFKVSYGERWQ